MLNRLGFLIQRHETLVSICKRASSMKWKSDDSGPWESRQNDSGYKLFFPVSRDPTQRETVYDLPS